jgi:hypothetical protein
MRFILPAYLSSRDVREFIASYPGSTYIIIHNENYLDFVR